MAGTEQRRRLQGSITKILEQFHCGFVLADEGDELHFSEAAIEGTNLQGLAPGTWVHLEVTDPGAAGAVRVRRLWLEDTEVVPK